MLKWWNCHSIWSHGSSNFVNIQNIPWNYSGKNGSVHFCTGMLWFIREFLEQNLKHDIIGFQQLWVFTFQEGIFSSVKSSNSRRFWLNISKNQEWTKHSRTWVLNLLDNECIIKLNLTWAIWAMKSGCVKWIEMNKDWKVVVKVEHNDPQFNTNMHGNWIPFTLRTITVCHFVSQTVLAHKVKGNTISMHKERKKERKKEGENEKVKANLYRLNPKFKVNQTKVNNTNMALLGNFNVTEFAKSILRYFLSLLIVSL